MADSLRPVAYAARTAPEFQQVVVASFPFHETIGRLKSAIESEGVWLIHEIDPQRLLERGGHRIHAVRQLLFFHQRYMVRLLRIDPNALLEAPLKLVVMQLPDSTVTVRCDDVAARFARYPGLEDFGRELGDLCRRLMEKLASVG